jgi:peptidoglycan/LPS O-acetylase OafA/YrhL
VKAAEPTQSRLSDLFNNRSNSLNLVRLFLAISVLASHSFPLSGTPQDWGQFQFVATLFSGGVMVDGFFALSGFLVGRSAAVSRSFSSFALNRIFRIFPGLFVCLLISGFLIAPIMSVIEDVPLKWYQPLHYIAFNFLTWPGQAMIGGLLTNVPFTLWINGSLWTLRWEVLAYISLWLLMRWRSQPNWFVVLLASFYGITDYLASSTQVFSSLPSEATELIVDGSRLGFMFLIGVAFYRFSNQIKVSPRIALVCAALFVGCTMLPNYRTLGGVPLAYLLLCAGNLLLSPAWLQRNDLSYGVYIYAFPIQQLFVLANLNFGQPWLLTLEAAILTLAMAFLSWRFIEKPAMNRVKPFVSNWLSQHSSAVWKES